MTSKQMEAMTRELHPQAENLVKEYVNQFAVSLLLHAKALAYSSRADLVLSKHVEEALDNLHRERGERSWSNELVMVIGGAFFGAFIQGFITELSNGNTVLSAVYTILGFIGMFLVFWGLRR